MRLIHVDPITGRQLAPARVVTEPRHRGLDQAPVPDGDAETVLAWVGYDPDRAKAAIVAELAGDNPNTDLLRRLHERIG